MDSPRISRALISVSDKTGLSDFARGLIEWGVEIYSTGGTRGFLREAGVSAVEVADYTQFPEMMDGRLKTLHPKVFGGILGRCDRSDDMRAMQQHGIHSFELVVVNLYPFEATVAKAGTTAGEAIEQIDIGGPSLVRAAAKNHAFTTIATDPVQYAEILAEMSAAQGTTSLTLRQRLAAEAFARTASYDCAIADYFAKSIGARADGDECPFPRAVSINVQRHAQLRYGENPHQRAAVYASPVRPALSSLVMAEQLNGKELSYNNYLDLDAALAIVRSLPLPSTSVIKHNNPCGVASDESLSRATEKALQGDPVSAFGSVLGMNRTVDMASAEVLCAPGLFVEAIVAPDFEPSALQLLTSRPKWKNNVRLIKYGPMPSAGQAHGYRQIDGGMLIQETDNAEDAGDAWHVVTTTSPSERQMDELRFAWAVVRHVKSNAIALTRDLSLCGAGAGQMSRIDSVEIAIAKAADRSRGAVLASDAFFPFADSIHRAAEAGIVAIIQPGGSKGDEEVISACEAHGIAMVLTGRRHFKH